MTQYTECSSHPPSPFQRGHSEQEVGMKKVQIFVPWSN